MFSPIVRGAFDLLDCLRPATFGSVPRVWCPAGGGARPVLDLAPSLPRFVTNAPFCPRAKGLQNAVGLVVCLAVVSGQRPADSFAVSIDALCAVYTQSVSQRDGEMDVGSAHGFHRGSAAQGTRRSRRSGNAWTQSRGVCRSA